MFGLLFKKSRKAAVVAGGMVVSFVSTCVCSVANTLLVSLEVLASNMPQDCKFYTSNLALWACFWRRGGE